MNRRTARNTSFWLISLFLLCGGFHGYVAHAQSFQAALPTVMAGTMEDRPRVLYVTQDRNLWVAYDTELGNLYRVWIGGLETPSLRSASFLAVSPSPQGVVLLDHDKEQKWRIIRKGEVSNPNVSFLGYRGAGNQLVLEYALETSYGERILVEERPEITLDRTRPILKRTFKVFNVPEDVQVGLDISAEKIKEVSDLKIEGLFQRYSEQKNSYYWGSAVNVEGRLVLDNDASSGFSIAFSPDIVANAEDNSVLDSSPVPRLRTIKALDSEGLQPVLRRRSDHEVGISMKVYGIGEPIEKLAELAPGQLPNVNEVITSIDLSQKEQFGGLDFYFITHLSGYLNVAASGEFAFRVLADDGVRLTVADSVLFEKDELQAAVASEDVSIFLPAGIHPIEIEHFQSTGRKQLTLLWEPPWRNTFEVLEAPILSARKEEQRDASTSRKYIKRPLIADSLRNRSVSVTDVHPSMGVEEISIPGLEGFIGGLDVLSSGRLVMTTWKGDGHVYILDGDLDSLAAINVKEIASGLNMPLGLKVVDDEIFVLQQHELTQLIDNDGNELIDEYRVVSNNWEVSTDYTELAVGLEYEQGYFFGILGMPLGRDGAILIEDLHHRGVLVRVGFDGSQQIVGAGMQLSGGVSFNDGKMALSDQRNPWFSDSRVLFMSSVSREQLYDKEPGYVDLSSIWLPINPSQTPTQPLYLRQGPYQGNWLVGDMVYPEMYRLSVDEIEGLVQGAVFPFSSNLPITVNRMVELPDGTFFAGGAKLDQPWGSIEDNSETFTRLTVREEMAFEMKTIRAVEGGFDVEFTNPLDLDGDLDENLFAVYQWPNSETRRDRTRKRSGREKLTILSSELSEDGTTVRLRIEGMKAGHIVYFNLDPQLTSVEGESLWSNEGWYSLNALPSFSSSAP